MSSSRCHNYTVPAPAAELVWQGLVQAGAFITHKNGQPFVFASGGTATLKIDAEYIYDHPAIFEQLVDLYSHHPCVQAADTLSFVPNGAAKFATALGQRTHKPVIYLYRPPGANRAAIDFTNNAARTVAKQAHTTCLVEDISNTGYSAHITAGVLRRAKPDLVIHTLSLLQRAAVNKSYQTGPLALHYHTFLQRTVPTDIAVFKKVFGNIPITTL